jgi:hypothetical protein
VWFRKRSRQEEPESSEWSVRAAARVQDARDGQTIEYPARIAVCPRGHMRTLPTRFSQPVRSLRCETCNRSYDIEL